MTRNFLFAASFALGYLGPWAAASPVTEPTTQGLVRVEANVRDEGTGQTGQRVGSGSLVERNGRYFVLTAAHVTVGTAPTLVVNGERLEIVKQRPNPSNDIEWIEVKKPMSAQPMGIWDNSCNCFTVSDVAAESMGSMGNGARMPRVPWVDYVGTRTRFRPGVKSDIDGTPDFRSKTERFTGRQLLSARMRHGESGAPLLRKKDGRWVIDGVAQSFDRNFLVSYYAAPHHFTQDIIEFDEPVVDRGSRWRLHNGVTYIDFGDGIREIAPLDPRASKVGSTDDGSKVGNTDDGGKVGATDDGSKVGNTDDGGKVGATDDGSKVGTTDDGGKKGVTDDGALGALPSIYRAYGVYPGIELDGKPIIAVRRGDGSYAYADRSAIEALRVMVMAGASGRAGHVATGSKLQPLLLERLKRLVGRDLKTGEVIESPNRQARFEITEKGVVLHLFVGLHQGKPKYLKVELNEFGGLGNESFAPLVKVKDPDGGHDFVVDLRGFYFEHLAWATDSNKAIPMVRVKQDRSQREYHYGFSRAQAAGGAPAATGIPSPGNGAEAEGAVSAAEIERCRPEIEALDPATKKMVEDFLAHL